MKIADRVVSRMLFTKLFPLRLSSASSLRRTFRNVSKLSRVCTRRRNYPSIAANDAYSLSRCRVDFDPARQLGHENSYQQVVTDLLRCCSSGQAENQSKSCYVATRTLRCSLTLGFPASIYADTFPAKNSPNVS